MHFALPPRKTSRPPAYVSTRSSYTTWPRRSRLRSVGIILGGLLIFALILSRFRGSNDEERRPSGTPTIVIVTVLDRTQSASFQKTITDNRQQYASKHGYAVFLPSLSDYNLTDPAVVPSWAKIPAVRHAMTNYPHSTYYVYIDQHALIMRPALSIEEHITNAARLESLMIPDKPVVPPDSVIKTFHHRRADQVDFILTQDHEGLSDGAFVLRRGEWAKFFLDAWFDPLYRSYNFQRAESHALEHLVQWHGSVLSRLALVPQNYMNSYTVGHEEEQYKGGDFVANLHGCDTDTTRSCEEELIRLAEGVAVV